MSDRKLGKLLAGVVLALAGSSAMADFTWNFTSSSTNTQGGVKATASAYSIANSSGVISGAASAATLNVYSGGLGVSSGTDGGEPTHAVDNNARTDMILFTFEGGKVDLNKISLGYANTDADFTILYFDTTKGSNTAVKDLTWSQMYANGWRAVTNVDNGSTGTKDFTGATTATSSWWIVSAFNTGFGGSTSGSPNNNNDYFKVSGLTGAATLTPPGKLPEPGSLALLGVGVLGLAAVRRRKNRG